MNQPEQPRTGITPLEILVICAILVILLMLLDIWHRQVVYQFCFGWIYYLVRNAENLHFDLPKILGLLLASAAFCGLVDCLIRVFRPRVAFAKQWRVHNSLMILPALLVSFTAGLAFLGAAHQIGWIIRGPAILKYSDSGHARTEGRNRLKQTGLAALNYHDVWNTFPAGGTLLAHGIPGHSWETSLLPYLDQQDLFQAIDLDHSWLAEKNKKPFSTSVHAYINPMVRESSNSNASGYALSHYAGNSHLLSPGKSISLNQIRDGAGNTLFAGEVPANFKPWGDPTNSRDPTLGLKTFPTGFGNPRSDIYTCFLFADGSARQLLNKIDPKVLKALATPDGGENLEDAEW